MRLQDVEAALREIVVGLEPEALAADAAAGLVDTFATIEKLRKIINNHVGIIELAEDLDIETVTEIFIRVNSAGSCVCRRSSARRSRTP